MIPKNSLEAKIANTMFKYDEKVTEWLKIKSRTQ